MRETSIDVVRYLMLLGVVAIHVVAEIPEESRGAWVPLLLTICSIAVPTFFVSAGYFLKWEGKSYLRCVRDPVVRLGPLYLFWLAIYAAVSLTITGSVQISGLRDLLSGGAAYHLWFLPALTIALVIVAVSAKAGGRHLALAVCAALAVTGFLRGAYHEVLHVPGGVQRGGVLMAPLLVWLGAETRRRNRARMSPSSIVAALAAILLLQAAENAGISMLTGQSLFIVRPYVLMTIPLGFIGLALARSVRSDIWPQWMIDQSQWTFGVYAVHLLLIYEAVTILRPTGPLTSLAVTLLVFTGASLLMRAMAAVPPLRRFIA